MQASHVCDLGSSPSIGRVLFYSADLSSREDLEIRDFSFSNHPSSLINNSPYFCSKFTFPSCRDCELRLWQIEIMPRPLSVCQTWNYKIAASTSAGHVVWCVCCLHAWRAEWLLQYLPFQHRRSQIPMLCKHTQIVNFRDNEYCREDSL